MAVALSATIVGGPALRNAMGKFVKNAGSALDKALLQTAQDVQTEAMRLIMNPPKTGIQHPELKNRSSAPGEAPATQSSALQNSIKFKRPKSGTGWVVYCDQSIAPYALALEFGAHYKGGRFMAARPFMGPALLVGQAKNNENVKAAYAEVMADVGKP